MGTHYNTDLENRLARLEGQIRGIKDMLARGNSCEQLLVQVSAASSALNSVAKIIFTDHITHCVVEGVKNGDSCAADNLQKALEQFLKLK